MNQREPVTPLDSETIERMTKALENNQEPGAWDKDKQPVTEVQPKEPDPEPEPKQQSGGASKHNAEVVGPIAIAKFRELGLGKATPTALKTVTDYLNGNELCRKYHPQPRSVNGTARLLYSIDPSINPNPTKEEKEKAKLDKEKNKKKKLKDLILSIMTKGHDRSRHWDEIAEELNKKKLLFLRDAKSKQLKDWGAKSASDFWRHHYKRPMRKLDLEKKKAKEQSKQEGPIQSSLALEEQKAKEQPKDDWDPTKPEKVKEPEVPDEDLGPPPDDGFEQEKGEPQKEESSEVETFLSPPTATLTVPFIKDGSWGTLKFSQQGGKTIVKIDGSVTLEFPWTSCGPESK